MLGVEQLRDPSHPEAGRAELKDPPHDHGLLRVDAADDVKTHRAAIRARRRRQPSTFRSRARLAEVSVVGALARALTLDLCGEVGERESMTFSSTADATPSLSMESALVAG